MRAVVMGGGPSLPSQLERCPGRSNAVYLSANHHGASLVGCDFIVALDKVEPLLRPYAVPIVARHMYGDYRILKSPAPNSGIAAAWVACLMGCSPIYIAGMDCGGAYFHDPAATSGVGFSREQHLAHWRSMMESHPADYRPIGGPLLEAFQSWNVGSGPTPPEVFAAEFAGIVVELTAAHDFKGRHFQRGERVELKPLEARSFVERARVARWVTA
jgi:hypothetical protein